MQLISLEVYKTIPNKELIRKVDFNRKGLSLIVDETTGPAESTGNSVGKSTVIKIIDLCLGAQSVNILYKGNDGATDNIEIKELLINHKVQADLTMGNNEKKHTFTRSLYSRGPRKYNGKPKTQEEYKMKLKEVLFNSSFPKPTIRQLISKFIRTDERQLNNILYYLVSTTYKDYEAIYFFLLKIGLDETISTRQQLEGQLRQLEKKIDIYKKDENIPSQDYIQQSLSVINKELDDLNIRRKNLNYVEEYREELEKETNYNTQIDSLNNDIQLLKFKEDIIKKSLENIRKEKVDIDFKLLKNIYIEAEIYNGHVNKNFRDVVSFHNKMVKNRYAFIEKQEDEIGEKILALENKRNSILKEKEKFTVEMVDAGLLEFLESLNRKIDDLNIQKGELQKANEILEGLQNESTSVQKDLENLNSNEDVNIYFAPLTKFNEYFSRYSKKLYGEQYILTYNSKWREEKAQPFMIGNLQGNVGTGKQRALSAVFDMSYVEYAIENDIVSPRFVIYDQMENTHINQLKSLFSIADEYSGQLIIPILKERLNDVDEEFIKKNTVVTLSQSNKFFKV